MLHLTNFTYSVSVKEDWIFSSACFPLQMQLPFASMSKQTSENQGNEPMPWDEVGLLSSMEPHIVFACLQVIDLPKKNH